MKTWQYTVTLFTAGLLVTAAPSFSQSEGYSISSDRHCSLLKQEIDVYQTQLRGKSDAKSLMVIAPTTEGWIDDIDSFNLPLAVQGHAIPPEVRADFASKNKMSCVLQPFGSRSNLRFISRSDQKRLASAGWNSFQEKYGKGAEFVVVSRVGFNSDKTIALVHVLYSGFGRLFLYEFKQGKWDIKFSVETRTS